MGIQLEGADGNGYGVGVNTRGEMLTYGTSRPVIAVESELGYALGITTNFVPVTATGGRVLWIKNTDQTKNFYLSTLWFNWNGGDTNHNRMVKGIMYFGDTEPDTNIVVGAAGVLNTSKKTSFNLDILYWDGVGNGMTGHTAGLPAFYYHNKAGPNEYWLDAAVILSPGNSLSFNMQGEELGEASINIIGTMS